MIVVSSCPARPRQAQSHNALAPAGRSGRDRGGTANSALFNPADNLLHLEFGAGMVLLAVLATAFERTRGQYPGREQHGR